MDSYPEPHEIAPRVMRCCRMDCKHRIPAPSELYSVFVLLYPPDGVDQEILEFEIATENSLYCEACMEAMEVGDIIGNVRWRQILEMVDAFGRFVQPAREKCELVWRGPVVVSKGSG